MPAALEAQHVGTDADEHKGAAGMVNGKRYQVFSMREKKQDDGATNTSYVRAGSAWLNRDGSMNVYLDVLPLDGRLHVREAQEKKEAVSEATAA